MCRNVYSPKVPKFSAPAGRYVYSNNGYTYTSASSSGAHMCIMLPATYHPHQKHISGYTKHQNALAVPDILL